MKPQLKTTRMLCKYVKAFFSTGLCRTHRCVMYLKFCSANSLAVHDFNGLAPACVVVREHVVDRCMCCGMRLFFVARRDLDDDVMLASSSPLKRTRSLGRLSRRWLTRYGLGSRAVKPKDDGLR